MFGKVEPTSNVRGTATLADGPTPPRMSYTTACTRCSILTSVARSAPVVGFLRFVVMASLLGGFGKAIGGCGR